MKKAESRSGATPRRRQTQGNADQDREWAPIEAKGRRFNCMGIVNDWPLCV
ncbi:hypothetical protein [Okeania sp. SIO2B9]|uniref:hypothetical protein n=1 Tax=Okeania sp. SIO2B9 TaxID=2607782 RepID=UPI002580CB27|nr:hypothetical protein [Okeania sp. SIO2B9]